jgi:hypothetical protein
VSVCFAVGLPKSDACFPGETVLFVGFLEEEKSFNRGEESSPGLLWPKKWRGQWATKGFSTARPERQTSFQASQTWTVVGQEEADPIDYGPTSSRLVSPSAKRQSGQAVGRSNRPPAPKAVMLQQAKETRLTSWLLFWRLFWGPLQGVMNSLAGGDRKLEPVHVHVQCMRACCTCIPG